MVRHGQALRVRTNRQGYSLIGLRSEPDRHYSASQGVHSLTLAGYGPGCKQRERGLTRKNATWADSIS